MTVSEKAALLKKVSPALAATDISLRNKALRAVADALRSHSEKIFEANRTDLDAAQASGLKAPVIKRLTFGQHKLADILAGIESLIGLPDPLGKLQLNRNLDEGLKLTRITCPIGVIGIIFEARPDALIQISTLCLKSGNCVILKGGSETKNTNRVLFDVISAAVAQAGMPDNCMALCEDRSEVTELLSCDRSVDLLIPRGSNSFVRYIMDNTRIPVMGHADGVCHIYVDKAADTAKAIRIITDAKTQYVSVCNALECLLIDRSIADAFLPALVDAMKSVNVRMRANSETLKALTAAGYEPEDDSLMGDEDYHTEYLDYIMSVKLVDSCDDAIDHINTFGSHHTDAIITEDAVTADRFMQLVDSADVYHNVSTRFADGFRYGFGAEVGISTGKLHARGPVGLEGLVTYKYKLTGDGHIVADYAEGRKRFNFTDLD